MNVCMMGSINSRTIELNIKNLPLGSTTATPFSEYSGNPVKTTVNLYNNDSSHEQQLEAIINMSSSYLITGVRYCHNESTATGPFAMTIEFESATKVMSGETEKNIPAAPTPTWRSYYVQGPNYLVSQNPIIQLSSTNKSNNCISIGLNQPGYGHTSYEKDGNGVWNSYSSTFEALIGVIREQIPTLVPWGPAMQGNISGSGAIDRVDAYHVTLTSHHNYQFQLTLAAGSGNINMRLVPNMVENFVGSSQVNFTSGVSYPKIMDYNSSSTITYVLLVEAAAGMTSSANYSVQVKDLTPGFTTPIAPMLAVTSPNPTTNQNIILAWDNVPYADNYTIYRDANVITSLSGLSPIKQGTTSGTYTDTVMTYGTYHYVVIATNSYGDSGISNDVSVVYQSSTAGLPGFDVAIVMVVSMLGISFLTLKSMRRLK